MFYFIKRTSLLFLEMLWREWRDAKSVFRVNRHRSRAGSATVACIGKPGFDLSESDFVRYYETRCLSRSCPELLVSRIDFNGDPVDIVWGTGEGKGVALGESYRSVAACMRTVSVAFFSFFFFLETTKTLKIDRTRCTTRENGLLGRARFRGSRMCFFNCLQDVSLSATSGAALEA